MSGALILLLFLALIFLGMPIAYSMIATSFMYIVLTGNVSLSFITQAVVSGSAGYTVLAIPFFMLAGELMNRSGITKTMFGFAKTLVGHIPGGLGHVNVLASVLFAGMTGSAAADASGLGNIEINAMIDEGYDPDFSVGVTAASSTIGPIIPPSSPMVLFGVTAGVSIGGLFLGGLMVGLLMALFMMITVFVLARRRNYPVMPRAHASEVGRSLVHALPSLATPVIIVGGMLSGQFTPTEAAAVAVLLALFLGFVINRELNRHSLFATMDISIENLGMIMLLIGGGNLFGWMLGVEKVTEKAAELLFSVSDNKYILLLIINLFLLFVGSFMETNASILILCPILLPIAEQIGMHPVQFGVMMVLNLMIGLLTPPMAICLYITSKLGKISFERAFRAVSPYYIALLVVLVAITMIPQVTLWLPQMILGSKF